MGPERRRFGRYRCHGTGSPCGRGSAGFTLLEVMVALVIVALGMMAVNTQLNRYVVGAAYLEEKTLASWVAANTIAELRLEPQWPAVGTRDEEVEFGARLWLTRTEVSETPVDNLRRIDVHIWLADEPEHVLHTMTSLVPPPAPPGLAPVHWPPPVTGTPQ